MFCHFIVKVAAQVNICFHWLILNNMQDGQELKCWVAETWHHLWMQFFTVTSLLYSVVSRSSAANTCSSAHKCGGLCITNTHLKGHSVKKRCSVCASLSRTGYRNLTCAILSPSAPRRRNQWGVEVPSASWAQSVRCGAEDQRRQPAGGDGASVAGQSPSWWDEIHQRGEWKQTQKSRTFDLMQIK